MIEATRRAFDMIRETALELAEFQSLTPREREVLAESRDGASNKVVAARLDLSPRTVEMYRASIFRKLGVSNLPQALERARGTLLQR